MENHFKGVQVYFQEQLYIYYFLPYQLDPWTESSTERSVPVRVPPSSKAKFKKKLDSHNIAFEVLFPDVQR